QAEDGIRDGHVTGVQTCALPIYYKAAKASRVPHLDWESNIQAGIQDAQSALGSSYAPPPKSCTVQLRRRILGWRKTVLPKARSKIGRASCRERVKISEGAAGLEE